MCTLPCTAVDCTTMWGRLYHVYNQLHHTVHMHHTVWLIIPRAPHCVIDCTMCTTLGSRLYHVAPHCVVDCTMCATLCGRLYHMRHTVWSTVPRGTTLCGRLYHVAPHCVVDCTMCAALTPATAALNLGERVRGTVTRNTRNTGRALDSMRATQTNPLLVKLKMKVEGREREVARGGGRRGETGSEGKRSTKRDHDIRSPRFTPRLLDITKVLLLSRQLVIVEMRRVGGGREEGEKGGERGIAPVMRENLEFHVNCHNHITPLQRRPVKLNGQRERKRRERRGGRVGVKEHTRPQRGSWCLHGNPTALPPPLPKNLRSAEHTKSGRRG